MDTALSLFLTLFIGLGQASPCLPDEVYDPVEDACYLEIVCETDVECEAILVDVYGDEALGSDLFEFFPMSPEDCFMGEVYDSEEQSCFIECETDAECEVLEVEIYGSLDNYQDGSFAGHESEGEQDSEEPLAVYQVDETFGLKPVSVDTSAQNVSRTMLSRARHQEVWDVIRRVLPVQQLKEEVSEYALFTDGKDNTLAYVTPTDADLTKWRIAIDIADVGAEGKIANEDFIHTIIHEFAHILVLESNQVPPDRAAREAEGPTQAALACKAYYTGEGCAKAASYINTFYQRFWAPIAEEHQQLEEIEDEERFYDASAAFFNKYKSQFVSDYAATNAVEDLAEVFAFFVLKPRPTDNTIAAQKIHTLYAYPELRKMRQQIRAQLARLQ